MLKLLFIAVILLGCAVVLKGNVNFTADNQVHVASWTIPIPPAVQNSPVLGFVKAILTVHSGQADASAGQGGPPPPPPLPTVTTINGTYGEIRPPSGPPQPAAQFDAVAKAIRGQ
jgi:hypothetical protein